MTCPSCNRDLAVEDHWFACPGVPPRPSAFVRFVGFPMFVAVSAVGVALIGAGAGLIGFRSTRKGS